MIAITGNTYPVKDQLRALGGRWDGGLKAWMVPDDKAEQGRAIVERAGPAKPYTRRASRYGGSTYTRFAGGGEVYRNRNGRCEDAPCCGCCS